jgi:hypothetical protein
VRKFLFGFCPKNPVSKISHSGTDPDREAARNPGFQVDFGNRIPVFAGMTAKRVLFRQKLCMKYTSCLCSRFGRSPGLIVLAWFRLIFAMPVPA